MKGNTSLATFSLLRQIHQTQTSAALSVTTSVLTDYFPCDFVEPAPAGHRNCLGDQIITCQKQRRRASTSTQWTNRPFSTKRNKSIKPRDLDWKCVNPPAHHYQCLNHAFYHQHQRLHQLEAPLPIHTVATTSWVSILDSISLPESQSQPPIASKKSVNQRLT